MRQSQIIFFGIVLVIVVAIAKFNSSKISVTEANAPSPTVAPQASAAPSASPSAAPKVQASASPAPSAVAQASASPPSAFTKLADQVSPAMILVSIFDNSGKLLRNGTGFFISEDGKFLMRRSIVEGGFHAVAKTKDGQIYNVTGILADAAPLDLAVLKAQPKDRVPFLPLSKASAVEQGSKLALIGNPLTRKDLVVAEGTVSGKKSDSGGDALDVSMPLPTEAIGSPAVNEKGEAIGVVMHAPGTENGNIVRASSALNSLLGQIGPTTKSRWQLAGSQPAASPSPPGEGPSPKPKLPLAGNSPAKNRLIYSPAPGYPTAARHSYYPLRGSGRYRVTFATTGEVRDVVVVQSTRSDTLDQAAVETLRRWKAQPGPEWTANVPITFQP